MRAKLEPGATLIAVNVTAPLLLFACPFTSNPARPPEVLAKVFESRYLLRLGRRYWLQYG